MGEDILLLENVNQKPRKEGIVKLNLFSVK